MSIARAIIEIGRPDVLLAALHHRVTGIIAPVEYGVINNCFDEVEVLPSSVRGKAYAIKKSFLVKIMNVPLEDGIVSESYSTLVS